MGPDFPVFVKLGMQDEHEGGMSLEEELQVVGSLESMDLDAAEISVGLGTSIRNGIRTLEDEA